MLNGASRVSDAQSPAIPEFPQIGGDGGIELGGFGLLFAQGGGEPLHLLVEGFGVFLRRFRADIAAGREHMAVLADLLDGRGFAEAGDVGVIARVLVAAPGMIGAGDFRDVVVRQFAMDAVGQRAELARVDEQRFAAPVAEAAVRLAVRARNQRQTGICVE